MLQRSVQVAPVYRSSKMSNANLDITSEFISDYAGGRLDAEDVQIIEEAIDHDDNIATAVADARRINSHMNIWLVPSRPDVSRQPPHA
jgi:anti-sigma-K factor RskA